MWATLRDYITFLFHWAPSPINWILAALVGIAVFLAVKKVVTFILDLIPFI